MSLPAEDGKAATPDAHSHGHAHDKNLVLSALGALGVVYGDIGTSPLYAMKECFTAPHGVSAGGMHGAENVLGILSLVFWSISFVIVFKYLMFVMRADNNGEGGVLALLALVTGSQKPGKRRTIILVMLGLFGSALLYGDGMITPAISVLSAVEGLKVATPVFDPYVVPITVGILIGLFTVQKYGTAGIGKIFGPATLLWFIAIGACGVPWIIKNPTVFNALNPVHAVRFFRLHEWHGFLVLGAVVLCITGGEALYADMGHFGKRSIRVAWYAVVFPCLLLNYFGQGALLLAHPEKAENPFFGLVPHAMLYPMVAIAAVATVVASQALISGAYSLTRQAIQLGYSPRMNIVHTSGDAEGQIYMPGVNSALMVACVALVLAFRESSNLAAAYGIAVTGTMGITSILFYFVAHERWGWSKKAAGSVVGLFLVFDLSYFAANAAKITHGGWFPIAIALGVFTLMTTWKRGRAMLQQRIQAGSLPLDLFMADIRESHPHRVAGTAVFLTSSPDGTPGVLLHHFKHNKVLHEQVVLLSVITERVPEITGPKALETKSLGDGFYQVVARTGFMQTPNVPAILKQCRSAGLETKENDTSYYLGRETLIPGKGRGLAGWRKRLFGVMSKNARSATSFFGIPPNRVVEIGAQIEL